jgi:hypothetical protein
MRCLVVVAWLMVVGGVAGAQPAQDDEAWAAYDRAFVLLAEGKSEEARVVLDALRQRWPAHPAAARAAERLAALDEESPDDLGPATVGPTPSTAARGELILWMTLAGIQLGATACIDRCDTDRQWVGTIMGTTGAAMALSVAATHRGIYQGQAQLYNSAMSWGSWNALGINDGFAEDAGEAGVSIAAQLGGLAAGIGLWEAWRPTQGDVALTNTVFAWSTLLALLGHLAFDVEPTLPEMVVIGDAALLAGALLSSKVKMSRGRTLLIDVGGILGMMLGGLIAAASDDDQTAGAAMLLSGAVGLGVATAATHRWDEPRASDP